MLNNGLLEAASKKLNSALARQYESILIDAKLKDQYSSDALEVNSG